MHCPSAIRMVFLSTALAFTPAVNADAKLDDMVMDHVLPRFDREARVLIKISGARYVSSNWNGETRTRSPVPGTSPATGTARPGLWWRWPRWIFSVLRGFPVSH
jgi:hypothetical protein